MMDGRGSLEGSAFQLERWQDPPDIDVSSRFARLQVQRKHIDRIAVSKSTEISCPMYVYLNFVQVKVGGRVGSGQYLLNDSLRGKT